jgi:glycine betaine/proline transport system substrate-binding protein
MIDRLRRRAAVRLGSSVAFGGVALLGAGGIVLSCASSTATTPPAPVATIELAQSPWNASRLDAAIARILLTTQLGVKVNVTEVDEYAQWAKIAAGTLHASLEVRPSGHRADIASYVTTGLVTDAGPLGAIGKIGWYIPSYLLTVHSELASWHGFQSQAAADLFATGGTGALGQFLAGDPTWTQYDADIIRNLGLSFTVVPAGTADAEHAELADLAQAYAAGNPILLYLWTPHWALTHYDLTEVALPPYTDACWAKAATHGIDCDYPPDALFKIVWPGLATAAPKVNAFLASFQLTTADQISLLTAVDGNGESIDDAANAWIGANAAIWQSWIPP